MSIVVNFDPMPAVSDHTAWSALVRKDRRFDGAFVYAAVTTGIYCRPSCPARNPYRKNTVILPTVAEAERKGYTACSRCHPNSLTPAEQSIRAALVYIENHLHQMPATLKLLSRSSGLSPHHLQQTFKRIVGLSPKEFADYRRLSRFKERLRDGASIADSCYEAGYGSSRALYEQTRRGLGMPPGAYRRGSLGILIRYAIFPVALGLALVAGTKRGVSSVLLADGDDGLLRQFREEFPLATIARRFSPRWAVAADRCSVEDPLLLKLPRILRERVYLAKVWNSLKRSEPRAH